MSRFFKMIFNEEFKIYIRKSTWVMYILLALLILASGIITKVFDDQGAKYTEDDWRQVMQDENAQLQKENEEYQKKMEENEDAFIIGPDMSRVAKNTYHLENDIQPQGYGASQFVLENAGLSSLVSLLTIIIAAGIVANEFRWGTIKLLLIRPISRSQVLLSKYASVLLFAFFTLIFVLIFSFLVGTVLFGVNGFDPNIVVPVDYMSMDSEFKQINVFGSIASDYGYKLINLVMMGTFAFMISSVFRNSALAIGTAVFLMFTGNTIIMFLSDYNWAKYILFANTDLKMYENSSNIPFEGMSLGFSITVLIVYYIVFLALSWTFFTKRDVAGQ